MALFGVCLFQCHFPSPERELAKWSMGLMGSARARKGAR